MRVMEDAFKILPNKKTENFSSSQIETIQKILDASCVGAVCISRASIFEEAKKHVEINMELYRFEQAITNAIREKKIKGYETKAGRNGGICKKGVFSNKEKKVVKHCCNITIENKTLKVSMAELAAIQLIEACNGKPAEKGDVNIFVNNLGYKIPDTLSTKDFLYNYLIKQFGGQAIHE